jgi:hypothetical protein
MLKGGSGTVPSANAVGHSVSRSRDVDAAATSIFGRGDDRIGPVVGLLQRLEIELASETRLLVGGQIPALQDSTNKKGQSLLELTRALRGLDAVEVQQCSLLLLRVRRAAEGNCDRLRLHLEAARSVTSMIAQSMRDAESDGTYVAHTRRAVGEP